MDAPTRDLSYNERSLLLARARLTAKVRLPKILWSTTMFAQGVDLRAASSLDSHDRPLPALAERVRDVADSTTLVMSARAKAMKAAGVDVINLTAGEPDFPTPRPIVDAALAFLEAGQVKYTPTLGLPELRAAAARRYAETYGVALAADNAIFGCGGKHVLYTAFQALCGDGDEVLIPSPYWVSYPEMARLSSARPVIVPTAQSGYVLDPDALRAAITPRSRVLVLNSPSNPTGLRLPLATLTELMRIAIEHNLWVFSDEIYDQLCYDAEPYVSPIALGKGAVERTVVVNSLSKTYSMTGWRIGYAIGPAAVIEAMGRVQAHETSNPCTISQVAALEALTGDQTTTAAMRERFDARRRLMLDWVRRLPGWICPEPQGAFYVFPRVDSIYGRRSPGGRWLQGSLDVALALMEEAHVATVPGVAFGEDACLRLSYATSRALIDEGMRRVAAWLEQLQPSS